MIAVDTNVLVHAHRRDLDGHRSAVSAIRQLAEGQQPWGIPVFCLGEFVRVVTHSKIFDPPSSIAQAIDALRALLRSPTVRLLSPGPRHPSLLWQALSDGDARGNLAFDAQIVAVCLEQGASRVLTLDRDFRRFRGIEIVPLEAT